VERLREVDYLTTITMIRSIENQLEPFIEVYDLMMEASKRDNKIKGAFSDNIKRAEAARKMTKYLAQKKKDEEDAEVKYQKNRERMAKKDAITRTFGKKQMVKLYMPEHKKYESTETKVKQNLDFVKYFGETVDFSKI
jgi:hypothetical protein